MYVRLSEVKLPEKVAYSYEALAVRTLQPPFQRSSPVSVRSGARSAKRPWPSQRPKLFISPCADSCGEEAACPWVRKTAFQCHGSTFIPGHAYDPQRRLQLTPNVTSSSV